MGDGASRIGYLPGLDGLRAVAVFAVLLFHSGFSWASGGFLGVSLFFTLSGYLITTLLLAEHAQTERVSLRSFYARRARRLVPASLLCLVAVIAAWPWWTDSQRAGLPVDVVSALVDVANWRFAFAEASYRDLFEQAGSPVAHYWSLSIEEQYYLVLPVVVLLCLRRGRRLLVAALAVMAMGSIAAMLATDDFDLAYNGTHTRAAELLVGALVAVWFAGRADRAERTGRAVAQSAGVAAMVTFAIAVVVVSVGDRWLMRGGLVAVAMVSIVLVVVVAGPGPLGQILGSRWLSSIGRASYGIYLIHWPLFMILTPERVGADGVVLLIVRLGIVAPCVLMSYRWIEQPIRRRQVLRRPRAAGGALVVAMAGIAVAVVVLPRPEASATERLLAAAADSEAVLAFDRPAESPAVVPATQLTVLVIGSRSVELNPELLGPDVRLIDATTADCPVSSGVEVLLGNGDVVPIARCGQAAGRWRRAAEQHRPDLVVVSLGPLDSGTVRRSGEVGFPTTDEMAEFADRTVSTGDDLRDALGVVTQAGRAVLLVDHGVTEWLRFAMERAAIENGEVSIIGLAEVADQVRARLEPGPDRESVDEQPARLLVVGDSTSLLVARAIHDAGHGQIEVQWAGQEGCAFVRTEATRSSPELDWVPSDCRRYSSVVPEVLASFAADAVLIVAGAMEMLDHRYPADPNVHAPGSSGYQAHHDLEMDAFVELIRPYAAQVLVADAPPLGVGSFSVAAMTEPWRVEGWNAQIRRWDEHHREVSVVPYAQAIVAYEGRHGSIRRDGSHPELAPLTDIVTQSLLPLLQVLIGQREIEAGP